mmetsp:Transcript_8931/g.12290  ORF Transcript_8931/g.12290 Transcript_8931/m.12290 type:complete len:104 (-) Transcript_8931:515-826(-)
MEERGNSLWWAGGVEIDQQCKMFRDLIEATGEGDDGSVDQDSSWHTPEGLLSQIILLDQLSRNAFRGDPRAFKYDDQAVRICLEAFDKGFMDAYSLPELQVRR